MCLQLVAYFCSPQASTLKMASRLADTQNRDTHIVIDCLYLIVHSTFTGSALDESGCSSSRSRGGWDGGRFHGWTGHGSCGQQMSGHEAHGAS